MKFKNSNLIRKISETKNYKFSNKNLSKKENQIVEVDQVVGKISYVTQVLVPSHKHIRMKLKFKTIYRILLKKQTKKLVILTNNLDC